MGKKLKTEISSSLLYNKVATKGREVEWNEAGKRSESVKMNKEREVEWNEAGKRSESVKMNKERRSESTDLSKNTAY